MLELQQRATEVAGRTFNMDSPKQIGALLFDELGLPATARTPTGAPSVNEEALEAIADQHELPRLILDYRSLAKLRSTYTDKLGEAVDAQGRAGRLAIVLGHAGNREDADLRAVAATAASVRPELVVLKDIAGYERGRGSGEVAAIMREQLLADGVLPAAINTCLDEVEAARIPLAWARDGDLLILPIHEMDAREQVTAMLDAMAADGWRAGDPLPTPHSP
jgi:hypothetical protein